MYSGRKPTKCKSCNMNYEFTGKVGRHKLIDIGFYCPLCKYAGKSIYHGRHEDLSGDSIECKSCHNYILYTDGVGTIWKDEIYFDKGYLLMRDLEVHKSYLNVISDNIYNVVCVFPRIVTFSDSKDLFDKIKTIMLFS